MGTEWISRKDDSDGSLRGQRIAFTGRLASLDRREAVQLLEEKGAAYAARVTRSTGTLVIGQDGWPLRTNGRLTRKLARARCLARRGHAIEIISEGAFLSRLGDADFEQQISRRYDLAQLSDALGISGRSVRAWVQSGLIRPVEVPNGVPRFDFAQVARARALLKLTRAGVSLKRLRRSVAQLERLMPGAGDLLGRLSGIECSGRLALCDERGKLVEPTGQRLLDFREPERDAPIRMTGRDEESLFAFALQCEEQGDYREAAHAYRALLISDGPDAEICFNLGNALYGIGDREAALEQFRAATALDPDDAEAWNNLANLLAETGRLAESVAAFGRALAADPRYADAHYGLADVLDELGRRREARAHWRLYLQQDPHSDWAEYARSRLAAGQA